MSNQYNPKNLNHFWQVYEAELKVSIVKNPSDYGMPNIPDEDLDKCAESNAMHIIQNIQRRFNSVRNIHMSDTLKRVARKLGGKPTYKALEVYLLSQ